MTPIPQKPQIDTTELSDASDAALNSQKRKDGAEFLWANRGLVLRRVRGKLRAARRHAGSAVWLDAEDILSTVMRRVDAAFEAGTVRAETPAELMAYIYSVTDHALVDRQRRGAPEQALRATLCELKPGQASPHCDVADGTVDGADALSPLLASARTEADRRLLLFKARGLSFSLIAAATNSTSQAVRKQWSRLRRVLDYRKTCPPPPPTVAPGTVPQSEAAPPSKLRGLSRMVSGPADMSEPPPTHRA